LGKDRTLLEYSVYQDSLYIFVMNSNKNELVSTYKPEIFDQWVDQFKTSIRNQDYETYKRVSYQLYTILIRPVESFLIEERELVIVPDGNLWHINFELLLKEKESSFVFAELPYLINSYAISYSNSASLTLHKNTNGKFSKTECIAFSYSGPNSGKFPNNTDQTTLRNVKLDLPGTREEIKSIASLVAGDYYYGNEANERFFKEYSRNYSLLHLAVHGDIVDEDPMLSKLYFSSLGRDSIEDGLLHVYEIYDMELNADMAVLSACNTGAGVLRKGEGIMSLGRAFQYAGVKSVVLSNWAVPDETAPVIMKYFYTNLKDGQSKSQALRNAKLSYLNDSELYASSPFFWGNFMIVGDASAIDWKESFQYTKLILLITGVVFVAFLFMIEQKR
ncbi:MAG: CHAT domain-containing protein, partial [Bacteroidota bacterium]